MKNYTAQELLDNLTEDEFTRVGHPEFLVAMNVKSHWTVAELVKSELLPDRLKLYLIPKLVSSTEREQFYRMCLLGAVENLAISRTQDRGPSQGLWELMAATTLEATAYWLSGSPRVVDIPRLTSWAMQKDASQQVQLLAEIVGDASGSGTDVCCEASPK